MNSKRPAVRLIALVAATMGLMSAAQAGEGRSAALVDQRRRSQAATALKDSLQKQGHTWKDFAVAVAAAIRR